MFKILYDNQNPFEGIAPTPLVSRTITPLYYSKRHGDVDSFTLRGTITGAHCPDGNEFSGFWAKSNQLIDRFSKPFRSFKIIEEAVSNSRTLYSNGFAIIRSIDFEDSVYAGILPFTVSLDVFREGSFASYGVVDPSQKISFDQGQNGDVTISKSTSANGFNTNFSALENAKAFVQNITGIGSVIAPSFVSSVGMNSAILVGLQEKINRFTGSYQVDESWVYNNYGNNLSHSIYEKAVTIDSGEDGFRVAINGKLQGAINSSFNDLRANFDLIDLYGEADEVYSKYSPGELFVKPVSRQITENTQDKSITFSVAYLDKFQEDPYLIDSISVNWESETNKTCAQASVEIRSTDPCPQSRWTKVKNYSDSFSISAWMKTRLANLGYTLIFPNRATTFSSSFNEQDGSISHSATLCDKKITIPAHFDDFSYTASITPAMPTFVPFQGLDSGGDFTVQMLGGLKRKTLTISGTGTISSCSTLDQAKASLREHINNLKSLYLTGYDTFLSQDNVQTGDGSSRNRLSFSFSWNQISTTVFSDAELRSSL
jgi:hypothetical protein